MLVFRYRIAAGNERQILVDDDLNVIYNGALNGANWYFAMTDNYYFVSENNVLTRRSVTDGSSEFTEFESVGDQLPYFVDADNFIWTIDSTANNKIRKWNSDLSSRTDYTLKTGNNIEDKIKGLAMTFDGQYMYVCGGTSTDRIAKYTIANLDNGNPEWSINLSSGTAAYPIVDENDNLYLSNFAASGGRILKYNSSGTEIWAVSDDIYGTRVIAYNDGMLYAPTQLPDANSNQNYRQIDVSDGSSVAYTAATGGSQFCVTILDDNYLFAGCQGDVGLSESAIRKYEINDNWVDGTEVEVNKLKMGSDKFQIFGGDPTGYLHRQFYKTQYFDNSTTFKITMINANNRGW